MGYCAGCTLLAALTLQLRVGQTIAGWGHGVESTGGNSVMGHTGHGYHTVPSQEAGQRGDGSTVCHLHSISVNLKLLQNRTLILEKVGQSADFSLAGSLLPHEHPHI